MEKQKNIFIVGGGLSGLQLAYQLRKKNFSPIVLEASSRFGGRIQTTIGILGTPLELGATWFSDVHYNLRALIVELGLKKYPQYSKGISLFQTKSFEPAQKFFVPESDTPSYRIAGGTQQLIDSLLNKMPISNLFLNKRVIAVRDLGDTIEIETQGGDRYYAAVIIMCMPPQLISAAIKFSPSLPVELNELMPAVQTWMAGAIKFTLEYPCAFWKDKGYSGMVYSHSGIVTEMYDHTNFEENRFGFTGFLNGAAAKYTEEVRKELAIKQLVELIGEEAGSPTAYFDKIWNDENVTSGNQVIQLPHQYNGHPLLEQSYMGGKLLFCGTETAIDYPGYMEGAVVSAKRIAKQLILESQ